MKLIKEQTVFRVSCHTDDCGYTSSDTYSFPSEEEVKKFLGIYDNYDKHQYYRGIDIFGQKRKNASYEFVDSVKEETEYRIQYEVECQGE